MTPPYVVGRARTGSLSADRRGKIGGRIPELRSVDGHMCPHVYASWRTDAVVLVSPLRSGVNLLVRDLDELNAVWVVAHSTLLRKRGHCGLATPPIDTGPYSRPHLRRGRARSCLSDVPLLGLLPLDWDRLLRLCRTLYGLAGDSPDVRGAFQGSVTPTDPLNR
jgi:hypothetical protein